jgi:hypothetical protein
MLLEVHVGSVTGHRPVAPEDYGDRRWLSEPGTSVGWLPRIPTRVSDRRACVRGDGEGQLSGLLGAEELEMTMYLIAFNDEWVPDLTIEELREKGTSGRAVIEEMTAAGVFVFSDGGLDASTVVCSVDPSSGSPVFTDGPFIETKEHLGGFAVIDVPDDAEARYWAGRIAVAVGWPQEVHRFPVSVRDPARVPTGTQSGGSS